VWALPQKILSPAPLLYYGYIPLKEKGHAGLVIYEPRPNVTREVIRYENFVVIIPVLIK
jgi:hypothetical protein